MPPPTTAASTVSGPSRRGYAVGAVVRSHRDWASEVVGWVAGDMPRTFRRRGRLKPRRSPRRHRCPLKHGQDEREGRPVPGLALDREAAAMTVDDRLDD